MTRCSLPRTSTLYSLTMMANHSKSDRSPGHQPRRPSATPIHTCLHYYLLSKELSRFEIQKRFLFCKQSYSRMPISCMCHSQISALHMLVRAFSSPANDVYGAWEH